MIVLGKLSDSSFLLEKLKDERELRLITKFNPNLEIIWKEYDLPDDTYDKINILFSRTGDGFIGPNEVEKFLKTDCSNLPDIKTSDTSYNPDPIMNAIKIAFRDRMTEEEIYGRILYYNIQQTEENYKKLIKVLFPNEADNIIYFLDQYGGKLPGGKIKKVYEKISKISSYDFTTILRYAVKYKDDKEILDLITHITDKRYKDVLQYYNTEEIIKKDYNIRILYKNYRLEVFNDFNLIREKLILRLKINDCIPQTTIFNILADIYSEVDYPQKPRLGELDKYFILEKIKRKTLNNKRPVLCIKILGIRDEAIPGTIKEQQRKCLEEKLKKFLKPGDSMSRMDLIDRANNAFRSLNYYTGIDQLVDFEEYNIKIVRTKDRKLNNVYRIEWINGIGIKEMMGHLIWPLFSPGTKIIKKDLEKKLRTIYKQMGYIRNPQSSDIRNWFEVKDCTLNNKPSIKIIGIIK